MEAAALFVPLNGVIMVAAFIPFARRSALIAVCAALVRGGGENGGCGVVEVDVTVAEPDFGVDRDLIGVSRETPLLWHLAAAVAAGVIPRRWIASSELLSLSPSCALLPEKRAMIFASSSSSSG